MKEYYISKETTLSGFGRTSGYYHLLIDFIIPLFVHARGDDITLHISNRRLDPRFDHPVRPGVMPVDRVNYIIECVFGDRLSYGQNFHNKHCGQIWLTRRQKERLPLPKVIRGVNTWWRADFKATPGHLGIWGEYDLEHYKYFREEMWNKFNIPEPGQYYVTIIHRGADANFRGKKLPKDICNKIKQQFKTNLPIRIVNFGDLSFEQTVRICRETKVLIGQHGAGLANCAFMELDSTIIEYGPFKLPCYQVLANCCGLVYNRTSLRDDTINVYDE